MVKSWHFLLFENFENFENPGLYQIKRLKTHGEVSLSNSIIIFYDKIPKVTFKLQEKEQKQIKGGVLTSSSISGQKDNEKAL